MYGAEAWTVTRREGLLERTEMRMLRWILGSLTEGGHQKDAVGGMHY